jgi:hypothetical protein
MIFGWLVSWGCSDVFVEYVFEGFMVTTATTTVFRGVSKVLKGNQDTIYSAIDMAEGLHLK